MRDFDELKTIPYKGWTVDEQNNLGKFIEPYLDKGITVILGLKRCFFCGAELGEATSVEVSSGDPKARMVGIITNACQVCLLELDGFRKRN